MRFSPDWPRNVLALKGNQGTLRQDVELFAAEQKANGFKDTEVSRHQTVDGDLDRIETRTYTAFHDIDWLKERHDWPGLNGVVMVESTREIGDKIERESRFYITSLVWLTLSEPPVSMAVVQRCLGGPAGGTPIPSLTVITCPGDAALAGSLRQSGDHAFEVETVKRIRHGATIYLAQSRDKLGYQAHWLFTSHQ